MCLLVVVIPRCHPSDLETAGQMLFVCSPHTWYPHTSTSVSVHGNSSQCRLAGLHASLGRGVVAAVAAMSAMPCQHTVNAGTASIENSYIQCRHTVLAVSEAKPMFYPAS